DSDGPPRPEGTHPPVFPALRHSRVVSSTSEEEEALTEKFLKINCKYITDGKGAVSGVLLVTPNNIMFDPHRVDPLVLVHGCEEYGIMCPLEEVHDLEPLPAERHLSQQAEGEAVRPPTDSGSTAPRSTEGSVSEDVFTESELSPIREEEPQASTDDLRLLDRSSAAASSESVKTVAQLDASALAPPPPRPPAPPPPLPRAPASAPGPAPTSPPGPASALEASSLFHQAIR
ncbi:hypothetical protein CRUP_019338, partial [Coryphaenoides rupestris]